MSNIKEQQISDSSRRAFLQRLSQAIGGAAAVTLLAGGNLSKALAYTPKPDSASTNGVTFSKLQMQVLRDICSTIIPRTDTASAADVDCHGFVDHQLLQCHSVDEKAQCKRAVDNIESAAKNRFNKSFVTLSPTQREELLVAIEALDGFSAAQKNDFSFLKRLIVFGYFTSEEGVTKTLVYMPYPGGYKGSVTVTDETRVSGSLDYY